MNYANLIELLQTITERKITHSEMAEVLNCSRANISKKVLNRQSEVTVSDLIKIQDYFGISVLKQETVSPKHVPIRDLEVEGSLLDWGSRLDLIARYNGFSDYEMAKILNIKESRYNKIILKSPEPKISELNAIKANFDVSIDDLLYDFNFLFCKLKQKMNEEKFSFESLSLKEKEEFKKFLKMKKFN